MLCVCVLCGCLTHRHKGTLWERNWSYENHLGTRLSKFSEFPEFPNFLCRSWFVTLTFSGLRSVRGKKKKIGFVFNGTLLYYKLGVHNE